MNRALHAFVTRSAFNLTLGHTHVDLLLDVGQSAEEGQFKSIYISHPGVKGLELRGLIEHAKVERKRGHVELVWKLTRAGELVYGLLEEAAVIPDNEVVCALPAVDDSDEATQTEREAIEAAKIEARRQWRQNDAERRAMDEADRLDLPSFRDMG